MIMNEEKEEERLTEDLENALKQRDLTGNSPLHLAIVMVVVWAWCSVGIAS